MSLRVPAILAITACGVTLAACGLDDGTGYQPVASTVLQQCVATHPDGTTEIVDDDLCEDRQPWFYNGTPYPVGWGYGGTNYNSGGHWYVRDARRERPIQVIIKVRDAKHGGSSRTQGTVRSYNEHVRKELGTTPTLQANSQAKTGTVKTGDDRRVSNWGSGSRSNTSKSTTSNSSTGRSGGRR